MSSQNDAAGPPTSQNDSIPLDGEESSVDIYSDEELKDEVEYTASDSASNPTPASSLDYSSVSRTYLSQVQSQNVPAPSADYTNTASYYTNSNSYGDVEDDEAYDYSSGYGDSMAYGDSTLRSPQSELSSTFASLYYENAFVVKARATLHFLRRPLYYFAFATVGSGAVGSICRLATTMVRQHQAVHGGLYGTAGGASLLEMAPGAVREGVLPTLPSGYPDVPAWLQEVRGALPSIVEAPAAWLLRRHNIPVLSDVLQAGLPCVGAAPTSATAAAATAAAAAAMTTHVHAGVQEAWHSWQKAGPAIPVALFLPLFSLVAIKVARHVRPNHQNFTDQLRAQQDHEDAEVTSAYFSTASPVRVPSVSASPIAAASSSPGNTSALSGSQDVPPASRGTAPTSALTQRNGTSTTDPPPPPQEPPPLVTPMNLAGATRTTSAPNTLGKAPADPTGSPAGAQASTSTSGVSPTSTDGYRTESREQSRSATHVPRTHQHHTDRASLERPEGEVSPLSPSASMARQDQAAASTAYDPAAKPTSSARSSPAPQAPPVVTGSAVASASTDGLGRLVSAKDATLTGDVVAAVVGTAEVPDANVALLAAVRYGCSAVLLPLSLQRAGGLLEAPPSLSVSYVADVLISAVEAADRRGLTLVGVTAQPGEPALSQPLDRFTHPTNALYVFVAHEAASPSVVAAVEEVVLSSVYAGTPRSEIPANQVFYDRLQKEKAASPPPPSRRQ